jgi:hypothetical protein
LDVGWALELLVGWEWMPERILEWLDERLLE